MTDVLNTKAVKEKIDAALKTSKETGKGYEFRICDSGKEITTTELKEVGGANCSPNKEIASFKTYPLGKDAIPSPADINKL